MACWWKVNIGLAILKEHMQRRYKISCRKVLLSKEYLNLDESLLCLQLPVSVLRKSRAQFDAPSEIDVESNSVHAHLLCSCTGTKMLCWWNRFINVIPARVACHSGGLYLHACLPHWARAHSSIHAASSLKPILCLVSIRVVSFRRITGRRSVTCPVYTTLNWKRRPG